MQPDQEQGSNENWSFRNEDEPYDEQQEMSPDEEYVPSEPVIWTASEFIDHQKNPAWYGVAVGCFLVLTAIIYALTKDIISIITISFVFVLFLIASAKKPQLRTYQVDDYGISIGDKSYPYSMFKSFALHQEGAIGSISFMPLKRLMPDISIYYAPEDEARIVDVLAANLPNDQRREHPVDRLMKHMRF